MESSDKEKYFQIPETTNHIPLEEFLGWYDNFVDKNWKEMSDEDRLEYFKDVDLKELKRNAAAQLKRNGLKDTPIKEIYTSLDRPLAPVTKDQNKLYHRIIEFSKLENDPEFLQSMTRKFLSQKAVNKMLRQSQQRQTLSGYLSQGGTWSA